MVDSVSNWASSNAFLQTQAQSTQTANNAAQQARRGAAAQNQTVIEQTAQRSSSVATTPTQQRAVSGASGTLSANMNLPRGSLIDIVV
ncbi:MAG: hypothetical protein PHW63_10830 [Alphaproteobacteria bacterium]|nr:hypothetical protein [Alphaproteobacteria bacterium]